MATILTTPERLARIAADLCPRCGARATLHSDGWKWCEGEHRLAPFQLIDGQITYPAGLEPTVAKKPAKKTAAKKTTTS